MQDFRKLRVWQRAQEFAVRIHNISAGTRGTDSATWRRQLRDSAESIPANISEGAARDTRKQFAHFLEIAASSASETESHIDFAMRTRTMPARVAISLLAEVVVIRRMIIALRKRILEQPPDDQQQ